MDICIFDSDGNQVGDRCDDMEDALHRASVLVCETWPNWERATIHFLWNSESTAVVTVERDGPRGSKRVRVLLANAGWVRFTFGDR